MAMRLPRPDPASDGRRQAGAGTPTPASCRTAVSRPARGELVHGPVELLLGDHQRRGEPDRGAVGVLGQHAAVAAAARTPRGRSSAPGRCRRRPTGPRPRTATTPVADQRAAAARAGARPARAARCWNSPVAQQRDHLDGRPRRPAGCRRRSSRARPGLSTPSTSASADHRRDRHDAAAERLAQHVHVGHARPRARRRRSRRCGRGPTGSRRR